MAKKDKKSKAKAGDWSEDEDEYMDTAPQEFGAATEATTEAAPAQESAAPTSVDEDEGSNDLMSALTRSKNKKTAKQEAKAAEERAEEEAKVQLKSKKEKEKEKKEREKLKKKQQAEKKKATQKAANIALTEQRAEAKAAAASTPEPAKKADPKSKKKSSVSAALAKRLQAQKEAAEAQRLAEEEELKRIAEEEAKAAEEERLKEEARLRKKEKEKQKKEELKAAGKFLTKKQKEQLALQERRRQQLLDSGVYVEGLQGDAPKKRPVYGKKKSKKPEPASEPAAAPSTPVTKEVKKVEEKKPEPKKVEEKPEPKKEELVVVAEEEEDAPLLDDWEAAIDSDGEVKDNWEELGDSEPEVEEKEEEKPVAQITKKVEEVKAAPKEENPEDANGPSALEKATINASKKKDEIAEKREVRHNAALSKANDKDLRSPICCILGHVDTGKTKLLDKIRQTNVQEGEAGGITQQIGATYFPIDAIKQKTEVMKKYVDFELNVPGLLVIDTPGHESFTNLRSRGSSLCNMAVLVIDIMHGLEQQTIESIKLLRDRKTPFIVALNKIDRLYGWESTPNNSFRDSFSRQPSSVQREFQDRYEKAKLALAEQGLNSDLYFQNKNVSRNVSIVPTSAVTGEGVPDLLYLLLELTQTRMSKQLMYLSQLEATILEVKVVEGLGTTIDVVLSNGILREGDRIVLCGQNGPIATNVRALLTPQPLRELRLKSAYVHHKEVKAALGVKIAANDLEKAVAGSRLLLVGPDDDEEELMDDIMDDLTGLLDSVDKSGRGVCVQASTLGSLEALLSFLKDMKIPVMAISIGPVYKRDIMRATAMLDKAPELALMLAFDVKIDKEAEQYATEQGIKIFSADIIYHLFDAFTAYQKELLEKKRRENADQAVYPCVLKTIQIINKRNPMIIGVDVVQGSVRVGTPITVVKADPATGVKQVLPLGRVVSLEVNHKSTELVKKGQTNAGVAMRLSDPSAGQPIWGRHVDEKDNLYSHITRKSIDVLKDPAFRDSVPREDWLLIKNLKPIFDIN